MNKLIIIGNGFDLAHGYKTQYSDFMQWIWSQSIYSNEFNNELIEIHSDVIKFIKSKTEPLDISNWSSFDEIIKTFNFPITFYGSLPTHEKQSKFIFHNNFFHSLCVEYPIGLWTDIESHYYKTLLNLVDGKDKYVKSIDELNENLAVIIKYFEIYLNDSINYDNINYSTTKELPFHLMLAYNPKYISRNPNGFDTIKYLNEFPISEHKYLIEFDNILLNTIDNKFNDVKDKPKTLILDFNYTKTIEKYISKLSDIYYIYGKVDHIKIHGELNNKSNPMNLGFGDEMDDKYKILEQLNNNKYLNYIKSFLYSNNSNYRNLLNWINTNKYQVHLMGHSCGLSDRIMLNTIFEHTNCKSIKLHYYEWKDNNEITKDDFTDKVQNISRHFNKKSLMRDKIVDKSLSNPLKIFN